MDDKTAVPENNDNLRQEKEHRKKRHKLLVTDLFLDFTKNTTLHGLRYVTGIGLSTVEKIFWFLMFVTSVILCFFLIRQVWYKWCDSPVIVTINERMISVEEVPFPAVTICPQMKNKKSEYEYAKQYLKYKRYLWSGYDGPLNETIERELKMLDDVMLVCDSYTRYEYPLRRNITNESTVHNIRKVAPTVKDTMFYSVHWRGKTYLNEEMFNSVITSEGVCFTFNTVHYKDMFKNESIQNQYFYVDPITIKLRRGFFTSFMYFLPDLKVYPRRGRESGAKPDLTVTLKQNISDNDDLCNSLYNGYKVYLHHPDDMPQSSLHYYPVLPGQVTSLAVKFSAMSTSDSLMKHPPDLLSTQQIPVSTDSHLNRFPTQQIPDSTDSRLNRFPTQQIPNSTLQTFYFERDRESQSDHIVCVTRRQCYSSNDHELRYFKTYTYNNCKLECLSLYTYKRCGCVSFHMPHTNSSEICAAKKMDCVVNAQSETLASKKLLTSMGDVCNCLPSCNSVQYDADILKSNFEYKKYSEIVYNFTRSGFNYSRLEVYFKEPQFVSMRRSELFGLTDFLANCGGLLGLFLGFSFLSIVEVFYFCTLRLWYAVKTDNKEEKKLCEKTSDVKDKKKKCKISAVDGQICEKF